MAEMTVQSLAHPKALMKVLSSALMKVLRTAERMVLSSARLRALMKVLSSALMKGQRMVERMAHCLVRSLARMTDSGLVRMIHWEMMLWM